MADPLGRAWELEPEPADWAREIHCGALEGMPLQQLQQEHAELWARNARQNDERFSWPGGESYGQFRTRVLDGLRAIAAAHAGRSVAVVTHAGVISQVLGVIRGRPSWIWDVDRPSPLTATEVAMQNGTPPAVLRNTDPNWY